MAIKEKKYLKTTKRMVISEFLVWNRWIVIETDMGLYDVSSRKFLLQKNKNKLRYKSAGAISK